MKKNNVIATSAIIEENVMIGDGTKVWYFSHIRDGAKIGQNCNIGDSCYIGKVSIGNDCKIGNNAFIPEGVVIRDRVFIGSGVRFVNVKKPKAIKKAERYFDIIINDDVSIGANTTIIGNIRIGKGAVIADGSVVIRNIPEKVFVAGNPAHIKKENANEEN